MISVAGTPAGTQTFISGPISWSHTVPAGPDRLLLVAVNVADTPGGSGTAVVPTEVTFGPFSMTQVSGSVADVALGTGDDVHVSYWILVDPPVSTADVAVEFNTTESAEKGGASISLEGVDQGAPLGATEVGTELAGVQSASLQLITTADASWVFDILKVRPGGSASISPAAVGADQTAWGPGSSTFGCSYEPAGAAPDTVTMSWDWSADAVNLDGIQVAIEILAAPETAGGSAGRLSLLGVG